MSKVTPLRLEYLAAVEETQEAALSGYASPRDVAEKLGRAAVNVRMQMQRLRDIGWLEAPYEGCYRLTDEGRRILEESRDGGEN